ncbi:MAG: phage tail tape measure protein [Lachnospirales bacterium]
MGKTINTILNLTDKFTPKLSAAGKQTLIFKQQLKNCNSAAASIDSGLAKLAKTTVAVGTAGALAMGAFAASAVNTYKDFQQSMSNVAGILSVDATSETYKKLESAAREAGKTTTKTAQESADALSYMALAGWSVEDSMNGLMPILRASEATGADLATTSDLVTDSMSALKEHNTGFLVFLQEISMVLNNTIENEGFFQELQWLLPVDFNADLYESDKHELFEELTTEKVEDVVPVRYCKIYYNDQEIFRPIKKDMLRYYVCKSNFKYAVGFHTFNGDKIIIDKKNSFSGIRIYIDNMLLCDENELLQSLNNYGLLTHTSNGQLQSVKGIGAMIYITDKVTISANARRTFIEVTDNDSIEFLKLLAEFVNTIYDTRYALSNYMSAKSKQQADNKRLLQLKNIALENLKKLTDKDVKLTTDDENGNNDFSNMSVTEQRRVIKKKISSQLDIKLKEYIKKLEKFDLENAYNDFLNWIRLK